jgi:hypothetical protein
MSVQPPATGYFGPMLGTPSRTGPDPAQTIAIFSFNSISARKITFARLHEKMCFLQFINGLCLTPRFDIFFQCIRPLLIPLTMQDKPSGNHVFISALYNKKTK